MNKKNQLEKTLPHPSQSTTAKLKAYFITGIVILLPVALTLAIVIFLFNLLTEPFVGIVKSILDHYSLFQSGFLFLSADQVQKMFSQIIILILLFFVTVSLGLIGRWFFFHYLVRLWDKMLAKIPFISGVYKACQDIIQTLFASSSNSFKQVVMVPFPAPGTYAIGLVTNEDIPGINKKTGSLTAVFVPTTPNPTSGFLMLFKEEDLVYLDMKVEVAMKYIISCGVIPTTLNVVTKEDLKNAAEALKNSNEATEG